MSFAFTAQNLGYLVGSLGGGVLYDRVKSHRLMALAVILMVLAGILIPLMTWFYTLLIVLFFFGLGVGTLDVGENLNLVWIFKSRAGPYMNAVHFVFGVGAFFTPLIISTVLAWTGGQLTWAIWMLVLLFFPGLIGLITLESPSNPPTEGSAHEDHALNYGLIAIMILLIFFAVGVQIGFGGWIFTYESELGIADVGIASLITSVYWGCVTLGRLIAIPVSKKVSPGAMLLFNFILLVMVLVLFLVWPLSPVMMWVGSAGMGLATSILFPMSLSFAKTKMNMTGRVTGLFFLGSSLGMMLLPLVLGQVFDRFGGYAMLLVLLATALCGLIIINLLKSNRFSEKTKVLEP
jgi:FHS family Na+ dependent glucose MFS transporter 1